MSPDQFRAALASLRWSQRGLADVLGADERQVRRWAAGATIPPAVAAWITKAAAWMDRNPPPSR